MVYKVETPFVGVAIIARNKDGNVLVIKRAHKKASGYGTWSIPGGWIDRKESFIAAAKRELFEETGLTLKNCGLFTTTEDIRKEYNNITITVIGFVDSSDEVKLQKEEVSHYKWCTPKNIPKPHFLPIKTLMKTKEWKKLEYENETRSNR